MIDQLLSLCEQDLKMAEEEYNNLIRQEDLNHPDNIIKFNYLSDRIQQLTGELESLINNIH